MIIRTTPGDGITIDDAVLYTIRASVRLRAPVAVTLRGRRFAVTPYITEVRRADIVGVYAVRPHKVGRLGGSG